MTTTQAPPVVYSTESRRPGLVTFAAVMLFVLSAFYVIAAITEWSNSIWLYQRSFSVAGSRVVFWGFVDFGLAMLSMYGGYLIWIGRSAGQFLGMLFAGVSFVRWMFYVPADPWLALSVMFVDGLIIFGLANHDDWFASRKA